MILSQKTLEGACDFCPRPPRLTIIRNEKILFCHDNLEFWAFMWPAEARKCPPLDLLSDWPFNFRHLFRFPDFWEGLRCSGLGISFYGVIPNGRMLMHRMELKIPVIDLENHFWLPRVISRSSLVDQNPRNSFPV